MIIYRSTIGCPDWLDGAHDLCHREADGCDYWGIGNPAWFTPPADGWARVCDGIDAAVIGEATDFPIGRKMTCGVAYANDMHGNQWSVPKVLTQTGERAFPVPIGPDYLPAPTDEQDRILVVATAARGALIAMQESDDDGIDAAASARWAVEILCYGNHINAGTMLALGLLDEALTLQTLVKGCCGGD